MSQWTRRVSTVILVPRARAKSVLKKLPQKAGQPSGCGTVHGLNGEQDVKLMIFFFQAEDGIRDLYVTAVQTCALPISSWQLPVEPRQVGNFPSNHGKLAT